MSNSKSKKKINHTNNSDQNMIQKKAVYSHHGKLDDKNDTSKSKTKHYTLRRKKNRKMKMGAF